jgi:dephospho-CoA kinase
MLRVGLTGNLGSGKSTAAQLFVQKGAHTLASDAIGRDLMQPGQPVFQQILNHFGPTILTPQNTLDRQALARIAFAPDRAADLEALNAIVHPAVIARQGQLATELALIDPNAILILESALIFESRYFNVIDPRKRFDTIILVTAPEAQKIARFTARTGQNEAEARRRLALQIPDAQNAPHVDYILNNDTDLTHLQTQVDHLWPILLEASRQKSLQ